MALIKCPECGREISDKAISCPGCGCPNPSENRSEYEIILDDVCNKYLAGEKRTNDQWARAIKELRERTGVGFEYARNELYIRRLGCSYAEARQNLKARRKEEKQRINEQMVQNLYTLQNAFGGTKTVCCPKCRSTSISYDSKKVSVGRAIVGNAVAGTPGAVIGGLSSNKGYAVCLNCGKRWKI